MTFGAVNSGALAKENIFFNLSFVSEFFICIARNCKSNMYLCEKLIDDEIASEITWLFASFKPPNDHHGIQTQSHRS